jgi:hypothetical protein
MDEKMVDHSWNTPEILNHLDRTPYGFPFASSVLHALKHSKEFCHQHRDYCGVGIFYTPTPTKTIRISHVYDGYPEDTITEFHTEQDFVDWLSIQSDYTLSGINERLPSFFINNQRITRSRLEAFIKASIL